MNNQTVLDLLEPLRAPDPIPWWPPAPGWWFLAGLALILAAWALQLLWRRYRRGAPLREARAAVAELEREQLPAPVLAAELAVLQRRVALALSNREACAGLTGEAWAGFLNSLTRSDEVCFDATLVSVPYQARIDDGDSADLLSATRRWLSVLEHPR